MKNLKSKVILLLLFCVLICNTSCAKSISKYTENSSSRPYDQLEQTEISNTSSQVVELENPVSKRTSNIKGVWIASVLNIDFPSNTGLSKSSLTKEIDAIISKCKSFGVNTIFFQVRPSSDALYNSKLFPISKYLVTNEGEPLPSEFDPLTYIIEKAHQNNIALHAWINPFRASVTNYSTLSANHPLKQNKSLWLPTKCTDTHGCFDLECEKQTQLFYDPALPQVRQLLLDGVMEIVKNYDVDGIHLDDYFYPNQKTFLYDDTESFKKYGSGKSIEDFRRDNTYKLVKLLYENIKQKSKSIAFGVSPGGIWADKSNNENGSDTFNTYQSYYQVFADTRLWVKDGIIDYIAPQIYFSGTDERAPFDTLVKWWSDVVQGTPVKLLIGFAGYKLEPNFANGFSATEFDRQLKFAKTIPNFSGSIIFSYKSLDFVGEYYKNY